MTGSLPSQIRAVDMALRTRPATYEVPASSGLPPAEDHASSNVLSLLAPPSLIGRARQLGLSVTGFTSAGPASSMGWQWSASKP